MAFIRRIISRASEDRLEKLIEERLQPGAIKAGIDKRIWSLFGERWAVLYTDLSGFSRNVAEFGIAD
jgi:adenylate cyclase